LESSKVYSSILSIREKVGELLNRVKKPEASICGQFDQTPMQLFLSQSGEIHCHLDLCFNYAVSSHRYRPGDSDDIYRVQKRILMDGNCPGVGNLGTSGQANLTDVNKWIKRGMNGNQCNYQPWDPVSLEHLNTCVTILTIK
jgi:hypothetical protein